MNQGNGLIVRATSITVPYPPLDVHPSFHKTALRLALRAADEVD